MALRAATSLKSMVGRLKSATGNPNLTTSTAPKMKAYAPAADIPHPDSKSKPRAAKGDFIPVYVALGMITLSVSFGLYTVMHQLRRAPNVSVKKSRRETLPELVEPDKVVDEADRFIKQSFFRKVAHIQDYDRQDVMSDPIRGDVYAWSKPRAVTLKSVGVDPSSSSHEATTT